MPINDTTANDILDRLRTQQAVTDQEREQLFAWKVARWRAAFRQLKRIRKTL